MRSMNLVAAVLFASWAVVAGCSSDDSNPPATAPYDSGEPPYVEAGVLPGPVTITITGEGVVASSDAVPTTGTTDSGLVIADGGFTGTVVCTSTKAAGPGTGACTAPQGSTLSVIPAVGWTFQAWTGGGAQQGVSDYFDVNASTPSPLTAVFVPVGAGDDAGAPAVDSGSGIQDAAKGG
jgi:hypothetical protein